MCQSIRRFWGAARPHTGRLKTALDVHCAGPSGPIAAQRGPQSRGIVVIMVAMMLPIICGLMIGIADLGMFYMRRYELQNAAEEQALTQALYVMANSSSANMSPPAVNQITAGNSRWTGVGDNVDYLYTDWILSNVASYNPSNSYAQNQLTWQWWAPNAVAEMMGTYNPMANVFLPAPSPMTLNSYTRATVPQFQWNQFQPVRARIVLVLDFSATMKNSYTGSSIAAINLLRPAVQKVLAGTDPTLPPALARRINWGAVLFAERVFTSKTVNLVPLPSVSQVADNDQSQYGSNADLIMVNLQTQPLGPPGGVDIAHEYRATNLSVAIDAATQMLVDHESTGSIFAQKYEKGRGYLLIISDGEPSYQDDYTFDSGSYSSRVQFARAQALNSTQKAWQKGYSTITITVQTDVSHDQSDINTFTTSISGDIASQNDPGSALFATDPSHLSQYLSKINPATHCLSDPQMFMPTIGMPWASPPLNIDAVYSPAARYGDNFFGSAVTYANAYSPGLDWPVGRRGDPRLPGFDPAPLATYPFYPIDPQNQGFYVYPSDYGINSGRNLVELNVAFCLPYLQSQINNPPNNYSPRPDTPIFRARWGYPSVFLQGGTTYPYR